MNLDDITKITQIGFYSLVGTVTILTFIRAKKGLLSPVNTEYHKKVIERLDKLSQDLLDEYDWDSPNHWSKNLPIENIVKEINEQFIKHKEAIQKKGRFIGIPTSPDYQRLKALVQKVKSDPFIPKQIRARVTDLLENRANVITQVHLDHLKKYQEGLVNGKYTENLDNNYGWIHNHILADLRKQGCGIEQIEKEIHQIRIEIQAYFERFDPD